MRLTERHLNLYLDMNGQGYQCMGINEKEVQIATAYHLSLAAVLSYMIPQQLSGVSVIPTWIAWRKKRYQVKISFVYYQVLEKDIQASDKTIISYSFLWLHSITNS